MKKIIIPDDMMPIVNSYYANNGSQLYRMVDKILFKMHFVDVDKSDFYSLSNEVFMYAIRDYDRSKSFDGFLYSCLYKKFCTEMTQRLRDKRCTKIKVEEEDENGDIIETTIIIPDERLDAPIGDDENSTVGDMIANKSSIERDLFEESKEGCSKRMINYLNRLSSLQKEVLRLNIAGYLPGEIREKLHISEKQYADCYAAIHSYRNVSVLF